MHNLLLDITTSMICSLILTMVFYLLYRTERHKYLYLWGYSFLLFTLSFSYAMFAELGYSNQLLRVMTLMMEVVSGMLMLSGAYSFVFGVGYKNRIYSLVILAVFASFFLAPFKPLIPNIIVHIFAGAVQMYSGVLLIRYVKGVGARASGLSLLLWGMHRFVFILSLYYPAVSKYGYQITIILVLSTTLSILLMHFERVKSELRKINEIFIMASENNNDVIYKINLGEKAKFEYVSPSVYNVAGFTPEELLNDSGLILKDHHLYEIRNALLNCDKNGYYKIDSIDFTSKSGETITTEISSIVIESTDGKPQHLLGIVRDITARSRSFELLEDSKKWYEEIFNNSRIMTMMVNSADMKIADCSASLAAYYCMRREDMVGADISSIFADDKEYRSYIDSIGSDYEFSCRHILPDKSIMNVTMFSDKLMLRNGCYYYITVFDNSSSSMLAEELFRINNMHRAILGSINEGVVGINKYGEIFFVNDYTASVLGYTQEELLYKPHHEMIHKSCRESECMIMNALVNKQSIIEQEDYFVRKDGASFPVKYNFSTLKESTGAGIIVFRDISEDLNKEKKMVESLEQNYLLMHELHHRVKNNFQVISSLLALHADTLKDGSEKQFLLESISKIHSLALIHESLYVNESLSYIDAENYFNSLLNDLREVFCREDVPVTINAHIGSVSMSIDEVIPCALIINELFTNAIKYAVPVNDVLEIGFSFSEDDGLRVLVFSDNGTPEIPETNDGHSSYGIRIIRSLVKQLKGQLDIDTSAGYTVTISYQPAEPVREDKL